MTKNTIRKAAKTTVKKVTKKIVQYKAIAALGNLQLPENRDEIAFHDFVIRRSPNQAEMVEVEDEEGNAVDVDWIHPEKPDTRFPVCDYYLETTFDEEMGGGWRSARWELTWALTRMRLIKQGLLWGSVYRVYDVDRPGVIQGLDDVWTSTERHHQQPPSLPTPFSSRPWLHSYEISEQEVEPLVKYVDGMAQAKAKHFEIPVARFHQSFDRDEAEDRVIDLFIALESLLGDGDSGALRYKIALRAAHLIGGNPTEKESVNVFLKKAYDARSKLVHGSLVDRKWFLAKSYAGVSNLIQLENITRQLLRLVLERSLKGEVLTPETIDKELFFTLHLSSTFGDGTGEMIPGDDTLRGGSAIRPSMFW